MAEKRPLEDRLCHESILCVNGSVFRAFVPRGWSVNGLGCELCLVRIDGERTTKRPPRIYHLPFKVKDRRIQGDGYVCSPKPSAAAVIHMG